MNCSRIRRLLSAYYDAELPAERRASVRRHVQNCEGCRTLLDGFKNLAVLTAKWTDVEPPASLWHVLAPKLTTACESAALANPQPVAALTERGQQRPSPRRTFKPILEGLEDRRTPSGLLGAGDFADATGMSSAPVRFASAVAMLHVDGDWSSSSGSAAVSSSSVDW